MMFYDRLTGVETIKENKLTSCSSQLFEDGYMNLISLQNSMLDYIPINI